MKRLYLPSGGGYPFKPDYVDRAGLQRIHVLEQHIKSFEYDYCINYWLWLYDTVRYPSSIK